MPHGKQAQGGLDIGTKASMIRGGESGVPALIPGLSEDSLLLLAARQRGDLKMPPQESSDKFPALSANELGLPGQAKLVQLFLELVNISSVN